MPRRVKVKVKKAKSRLHTHDIEARVGKVERTLKFAGTDAKAKVTAKRLRKML